MCIEILISDSDGDCFELESIGNPAVPKEG
jgi:hypothetical protein